VRYNHVKWLLVFVLGGQRLLFADENFVKNIRKLEDEWKLF
jgi:hypothetical protein